MWRGKRFIFSNFAGLQAYRLQHYYQMNSFTGIFQQHFTPPPAPLQSSPCIYLRPPIKFRWATSPLMHSPSMFATPVGKSTSGLNQASYLGLILVGGLGTCVCGTPCLLPWVLGCSRKNPKKGWVDDIYTFLKKPLGFIYLSLYP